MGSDIRKDLRMSNRSFTKGLPGGNKIRVIIREIISWILVFAVAFGIAYFVDTFIIINATVPSGSMENTIQVKDRMIGNRLAYKFGEPKRGDIVIFEYPDDVNNPNVKKPKLFVKRLIGLPGEKVEIKDGQVYITNRQDGTADGVLEEDYLKEDWTVSNTGYSFDIPKDQYFMLGDNRNNSKDSRFWEDPFVERKEIKAKAIMVYWPIDHMGIIRNKNKKDADK